MEQTGHQTGAGPLAGKKKSKALLTGAAFLLVSFLCVAAYCRYLALPAAADPAGAAKDASNATFVVVDKQEMILHVYDFSGKERMACPVTTGFNYGNKRKVGDYKTPEGIFHVQEILDASTWEHDFGDGRGSIRGAYGPLFFRLFTPGHKGIGIHGTHKPEMLGKRDSEGCIRMKNENLAQFRSLVGPGTVVIVLPGDGDVVADLMEAGQLDSVSRLVTQTARDLEARKKAARPGKR